MDRLSKAKMDILEFLWRANRPVSLKEIARETGLKTRSANMHIMNLKGRNYVAVTGDGYYVLTDLGREILGFPRVDRELAERVLGKISEEMRFHFYIDLGRPLMISANDLTDFCEKIKSIELKSIEFHSARGDFENWIRALGDIELASRLKIIRESNLHGEDLREEIYKAVKSRHDDLRTALSSPRT